MTTTQKRFFGSAAPVSMFFLLFFVAGCNVNYDLDSIVVAQDAAQTPDAAGATDATDSTDGAADSDALILPVDVGNDATTMDCDLGASSCSGNCVDLTTDSNHCGQCGTVCNPDEVCESSICQPRCSAELTFCPDGCVNTLSDAANCGSCGNTCVSDQSCQESVCLCAPGSACAVVGIEGRIVGGACNAVEVCDVASECLTTPDFPAGTCSTSCTKPADCSGSSECIQVNGSGYCLLNCTVNSDCRDGYSCRPKPQVGDNGTKKVCFGAI